MVKILDFHKDSMPITIEGELNHWLESGWFIIGLYQFKEKINFVLVNRNIPLINTDASPKGQV